ncbi:MAG: PilZ domain-containing protein, partial [Candidatus Methylomirabilales bacterium]
VRCVLGQETETPREVKCQTDNVSLGGLLLCVPEMLTSGTFLRLGLSLPDGAVTANGTVTWQSPHPRADESCPHGVRLLGFVDDTGLFRYRRFLSQVAANPIQGTETHS